MKDSCRTFVVVLLLVASTLAFSAPSKLSVGVPTDGAYLGGSIYYNHQLAKMGGSGQAAQITVLEQDLGRSLDIDNNYYCFDGVAGCSNQLTGNTATASDQQYNRMPLDSWSCSTVSGYTLESIASGFTAWSANHKNRSAVIAYIIAQAQAVSAYGDTTFIRWAWEMTAGGANGACVATDGGATAYIQAWQAIYTLFHYYNANNAVFVWCPSSSAFNTSDGDPMDSLAATYYPGNAYVDYVCADNYNGSGESNTFTSLFGNAYQFSQETDSAKPKPFMVGETGDEATDSGQSTWIANFFAEVKERYPDVKAVLYWDSYDCSTQNDYTVGWPSGQETVPASVEALRSVIDEAYFNPRGSTFSTAKSNAMVDTYTAGCTEMPRALPSSNG